MKIPKPAEGDRERFTALVPEAPQVEVKPMFGNLGAFVNGNMFMGLFGSDVGIKLPDDDQQQLLAEPGTGPWPDTSPSQLTGPQTPRTTGSADHWPTWLACRRSSPRHPRNHAGSPADPQGEQRQVWHICGRGTLADPASALETPRSVA